MKSSKFLFLFLFLTLFSISFVSAAPPFPEVGSFAEGFDIKYPNDINIQQWKNYEFKFHIFNSSNGVPIHGLAIISCYFHLYNSSGKHQLTLEENTPSHIFDYSFEVDGSNFSELGQYSYIAQCNSSSQGGFVDVAFEVTSDGRTYKSILNNPYIIIFLAIFIILFLLAYTTKIAWLGFVSSIPLILCGIFTMIYGFTGFNDLYTRGIAVVIIGVGMAIMIISAYDWVGNISEES